MNFTLYSNELAKKLNDLSKYKTKIYFEELVLFLYKYLVTFKIIHYFYPYNNNALKEGELKYSNYYIYYWYNLYCKKYNFSVRIRDQRYDIIFPDENQDNKVIPYFILNENNSLLISKNSFLKQKTKNFVDNKDETKILYFEKADEENTDNMFKFIFYNFNGLYKESPLKTNKDIDAFQLQTLNFYTNNISTLVSRIWSLIINLTDKFPDVLKYLKNSCCFLEQDTMEIFQFLYQNNLDINLLDDLINNLKDISFFCESKSESMLWKYRIFLNKLELDEKEEINYNKYYQYFKSENIDADDELSLLKNELNNIQNKLPIYWPDDKIDIYKSKLLTLQNLIISYKNKDIEDAEITKLRNDGNTFMYHLDNKVKL